MTNGNDVLEFEEEQYQTLIEEFIYLNKSAWDDHVLTAFDNRGD